MKSLVFLLLEQFPKFESIIRQNFRKIIAVNNAFKMYFWFHSWQIRNIIKKNLQKVDCLLSQKDVDNKIVIICISRNENRLLEQWIKHHSSLNGICAIAIVDHLSSNPIEMKIFEKGYAIDYHLYRFKNNNYFQAHILNAVALSLINLYGNAIFVPLDTDEFISQKNVNDFRDSSETYGYLDWRMAWPKLAGTPGDSDMDSLENCSFKLFPSSFLGNKHFMRSSLLKKGFLWGQGAHEIYNKFGFIRKGSRIGEMIHLPVRSYGQIITKFGRGSSAHLHKSLNSTDTEGKNIYTKHWNLRFDLLATPEKLVEEAIKSYLPPESDMEKALVRNWTDLFK